MQQSRLIAGLAVVVGVQAAEAQGWRNQGFGAAVAVAGDEVIVAASPSKRWEPRGGMIYFYRKGSDGAWTEVAVIDPKAKVSDKFGASLATDGEWLAVGAPGTENGGAVFLYRRQGGKWNSAGRVAAPGGASQDNFAASMALDGGQLIITASGADSGRGALYAVAVGKTVGGLTKIAAGRDSAEGLGRAIALRGNTLFAGTQGITTYVAGADGQYRQVILRAGTVKVFKLSGGKWSPDGVIASTDSIVGFGESIAAIGKELWVGAPGADQSLGAVFRLGQGGGQWKTLGKLTVPPPETPEGQRPYVGFGSAIVEAGQDVLVTSQSGKTYLFSKSGNDWTLGGTIEVTEKNFSATDVAASKGVVVQSSEYGQRAIIMAKQDGKWAQVATLQDKLYEVGAITGSERKCAQNAAEGFGCDNVDLLAFLPISAIGGDRTVHLNDIWGWTDGQTGHEYALVGRSNGTAFVDITDPIHPIYVGELPLTPGAHPAIWRDIKVYKDHAFVVSDGSGQHGIQVFDLARLRNVSGTPETFAADTVYTGIASAHNIVIDTVSGYAYAVGSNGGGETCGGALHMVDIREPKAPKFAGCFADKSTGMGKTGYTHDAICVVYHGPDRRYTGRQICVNSSENAVGIADVTDKSNPVAVAAASYPNSAYAHQGWLSDDHRYFFLDDELDELGKKVDRTRTLVWDLSKLDEPVLVKEYLGTTGATDHNLYVRGHYLYEANYVSGLRIIDIADPLNPVEAGYFDTVPWGDNSAGFDGAWSNYPYFKSGVLIVSSIGQGLFILKQRKEQPVQ